MSMTAVRSGGSSALAYRLGGQYPASRLPARLWWRLRLPGVLRRRRQRWSTAQPSRLDLPPDFNDTAARRLWPGATLGNRWREFDRSWPDAIAAAATSAADAVAGRFDLLGSTAVSVLDSHGHIRWHQDVKSGAVFPRDRLYLDIPRQLGIEGSDIKVPWELSRFQQVFAWLWTDPARYGDAFLQQWRNWLAANPLARGVNWSCAMDVALRAVSWTAALACWWPHWDRQTRQDMYNALLDHGRFIEDNLEYNPGANNNHYFSDLVGLAVLAAVLGGEVGPRWAALARRQLEREILGQFAPDGFDKECSSAYHRLMLELAALAVLACQVSGRPLSSACRRRLAAGFGALHLLTGPAGTMPLIGDNDSGRVFPMLARPDNQVAHLAGIGRALLPEADLPPGPASPELVLLFGPQAAESAGTAQPAAAKSGSLPRSGLFVLDKPAGRMVIRCGPSGYPPVGGHPHQDQLSFTLEVAGKELLVDPGQFCYTPWPRRSLYYRGPWAHNTVVVDGQPQCPAVLAPSGYCYASLGPFRARCSRFDELAGEFIGWHDGYRRLARGGRHVRRISFDAANTRWVIHDRLELAGAHLYSWYFHLHPQAQAQKVDQGWLVRRGSAAVLLKWIRSPDDAGTLQPATFAPGYGLEVPSQVLVFEAHCDGTVASELQIHLQP